MHERRLVGARPGYDNTPNATTAALPVLSLFSILRRNALPSLSSRSSSQRLRRAQGLLRTDLVGWWCLAYRRANQSTTCWFSTSKSAATLSRRRYTFRHVLLMDWLRTHCCLYRCRAAPLVYCSTLNLRTHRCVCRCHRLRRNFLRSDAGGRHDAMAAEVEGPENYAGDLCSGTVHHTWYYLPSSWLIV